MADFKGLFSERAQENEEYNNKVILPTDAEFNRIKRFIDAFPDLVSLDYAPKKYMSLIGKTFGYPYLETEDPDTQREIYKRLIEIYKNKGSAELMEKALGYSWNSNYALGDMTYYHDPIEEAVWKISFPRDSMFRYDYSKWDNAKWPDAELMALGIINVTTDKLNDRVETYLDSLIPAGIKYTINISKYIDGIKYPYIAHPTEDECPEGIIPSFEVELEQSYDIDHTLDEGKPFESDWKHDSFIMYVDSSVESIFDIGTMYTPPRPSDRSYRADSVSTKFTPLDFDKMRYGDMLPSNYPTGA